MKVFGNITTATKIILIQHSPVLLSLLLSVY